MTFIGRIGQDMFGEMALKTWRAAEIETAHVQQSAAEPTGVATILVTPTEKT